ncbi:carboxylesterase family protein [Calycomorphotria hydatis]|nr:prolyl oligopeptidase family serine peptidase [Calycomorphotria hydatis]
MNDQFLLCVALFAFFGLFATTSKAGEDFKAEVYQSAEGQELNYRIHVPEEQDASKRYPLVLFLHGAGERGSDNEKQLVHGVKDMLAYSRKTDTPFIIVAPQCPTGQQWVNTPWSAETHTMPEEPSEPMSLVIGLLEELQSTLPVDKSRLYATGLSMGGFGTWDIVQRKPDTFAAAIPICGGGDTAMADTIKDVPIWVFHGDEDRAVIVKRSRDMVAALEEVDGNVKYTEYEGVGHNSWTRTYTDDAVLEWLLSQNKED